MEIDKSKIKISTYSPELHKKLLMFMISQYENRSTEYLDWWLTNIDNGDKSLWKTTLVVFYENDIIGCYTSNPLYIEIKGETTPMFYGGNAIINPEFRGVGIGKMIYTEIFKYNNRISIGLTAASYAIQTQKFKGCYPILNVRVYVSANRYCFMSLIGKFWNRTVGNVLFPDNIKMSKCVFSLMRDIKDLDEYPEDGIWLNDFVEIKRDKKWLRSRFIDIYRKDYYIYTIRRNEELVGYAVFRKGRMYGIDFISIVDFRCKDEKYERVVTKVAHKIAKVNKIGFTFCMSSRLHSLVRLLPFTIRLPKKIKNVTVVEKIKDEKILITSADSNLDFVYYE